MVYKIDLSSMKSLSEKDREILAEIMSEESGMTLEEKTAKMQQIFSKVMASKGDKPKSDNMLDLMWQGFLTSHQEPDSAMVKAVQSNKTPKNTPARDENEEWNKYLAERDTQLNKTLRGTD
jgi:hypothetical protein